ncbi:MAG: DUF255 domain-containing protein [Bacteroidota bacterium]
MKKTARIFIAFSIIVLLTSPLAAQKINFSHESWPEVLAKAKAENKYIFMDANTSWCSWCKVQDRETFTNTEVIALVESKCIAVQYDFEEGEGLRLAKKFRTSGFPTNYIFSPEGIMIHRIVGYEKDIKKYTEDLNKGFSAKVTYSPVFDAKLLDLKYPEFYDKAYGKKKIYPKDSVLNAYLDQQTDLYSEINYSVMKRFSSLMAPKYWSQIMDNLEKYQSIYGADDITELKNTYVNVLVSKAAKEKNEDGLNLAIEKAKALELDKEGFTTRMKMNYYGKTGENDKYLEASEEMLATSEFKDPDMVNATAWFVYEKIDDPIAVKRALGWFKNFDMPAQSYAVMDTYACLLYKDKQFEYAKKFATLALEKGKTGKDDVSDTEKMLKKIDEALKNGKK